MNKIVGMDLGTTNSLVATLDSCIPLFVADAEGWRSAESPLADMLMDRALAALLCKRD